MVLAGALDVASFVVNIFVALGTLLAALIALWLGLAAMSQSEARENRLERADRRQVTLTVTRAMDQRPEWDKTRVEVINGSSSLISNVAIELHFAFDGPWRFQWGPGEPPTHVAARSSESAAGSFYCQYPEGDPKHLGPERKIVPDSEVVHWLMVWQDAHGRWWGRRDGGEPLPTDGPLRPNAFLGYAAPPRRARFRERLLKKLRLYPWPGSTR